MFETAEGSQEAPQPLQQYGGVGLPNEYVPGRYSPLSRILFFDDFDAGANGWCELIGNHHRGNLNTIRPIMADFRPPQISSCSFFDIGTHGSVDGTYALKLATRPSTNHMSTLIKRLTYVQAGLVQLETYFTFKAEAVSTTEADTSGWDGNWDESITSFGDFTISNDVVNPDGDRAHTVLRYVNADAKSELVQTWFYKTSVQQTTRRQLVDGGGKNPYDYHTQSANDWQPLPDGKQEFCFNEIPTKVNWHYLRWVFDTRRLSSLELTVNNRTFDLRDVPVPRFSEKYHNLANLLNLLFDVRTNSSRRNFLYLDSVLVSVDW